MAKMFLNIRDYFTSSYAELRQVTWPSRQDVARHTAAIAISVIFAIIFLGLLDYGLTVLLRQVILK